MPVAADQHQHGEFVAEARHAAFADRAAAVRDYAGQVVDHPGAIAANGGYGEVLLHLAASVPQPFGLRMAGVRPYHARPFKRPSDLTHVRRQPGGARDPDAAGRQHRLRRLVASPRIPRRQWHHGHRRGRIDWRIRHRHRRRAARPAACTRAASLGKRALLIANAGTSSTATSVERARWISELDVDALLVASPAYVRPTQQGLFLHFEAIAANSRIPVLLYNVPSRTAVDLLPATVARLSRAAAHRRHQGSGGRGGACARARRELRRELQGAEW